MQYSYPTYQFDLSKEKLEECARVAFQLLADVGILVRHERFRKAIQGQAGVTVSGERIRLATPLVQRNFEKFLAKKKQEILDHQRQAQTGADSWKISTCGFSMAVLDLDSDEVRPATCRDLRDLIRLMDSYGIGGSYPVMPQDVPPIMQALACFKICWESSDKVRPYDYQHISQTDYLYEMHRVMGKPFVVTLTVTQPMALSEDDLDIFFKFLPAIQKGAPIAFQVLDYPMLGVSKPITAYGCATLYIAEMIGVHTLFNLLDPSLEMPITLSCGLPTDMRSVAWAYGHPRRHLFHFLNTRLLPMLCGVAPDDYRLGHVLLESGSCALDEQAGLEKLATGLMGALNGARSFTGAGNLAVDDLFSGVQLAMDMEIVAYIREVIEAYNPHPDIFDMTGLYDLLRDVSLEIDQFVAHPDTAAKIRTVLPSSTLIAHEKLRQWQGHHRTFKDRARAECKRRLQEHRSTFRLATEKQAALDEIYRRAEVQLAEAR